MLPKSVTNSLYIHTRCTFIPHIWSESNQLKFSIPYIPKTVLWSSRVAESDDTMGGSQIKKHTFLCISFKYCNLFLLNYLEIFGVLVRTLACHEGVPGSIPPKSLVAYIFTEFF